MSITMTALASSNTGSTFNSLTNIANAYTNTSSTTYARLNTPTRTSGTYLIYFTGFDFSSIPSDAVINSVTIKVKAMINSTSYIGSAYVQAYNGTTAVGSQTSYRTTSATTYTLSSGTWTRAELDNMRVMFNINRTNTKNNQAYARIYGIEVIVDWSRNPNSTYLTLKENGSYVDIMSVYKKINNVWVLQTDLENVFDENTNYVRWN